LSTFHGYLKIIGHKEDSKQLK